MPKLSAVLVWCGSAGCLRPAPRVQSLVLRRAESTAATPAAFPTFRGSSGSKRSSRRRRTLDFTGREPLVADMAETVRRVRVADAPVDVEAVAASLGADDVTPSALAAGITALLTAQSFELAEAALAAKGAQLGAEPAALSITTSALLRAGRLDALTQLAEQLWPVAEAGVVDASVAFEFDGADESDALGAPRASRVYGPLVAATLRQGRRPEALQVARRWAQAELGESRAARQAARLREPASPIPFTAAIRAARKSKCLPTMFAVLDAMRNAGCVGDDETFEEISNAAARSVRFVTGAVSMETLPEPDAYEAVLVGRSNVGKSSLVNMLCNRKAAAFTSKKPGRDAT